MRFLAIALFGIAGEVFASTFCNTADRYFYDNTVTGDQVVSIKECLKNGRYSTPTPASYSSCMVPAGLATTSLTDACKSCMAGALFDIMDCEAKCNSDGESWACATCKTAPNFVYGVYYCSGAVTATSPCSYADETITLGMNQNKAKTVDECLNALSGTVTNAQVKACFTNNSVSALSDMCLTCGSSTINAVNMCAASCTADATGSPCTTCLDSLAANIALGGCNKHEAPVMPKISSAGHITRGISAAVLLTVVAIFSL